MLVVSVLCMVCALIGSPRCLSACCLCSSEPPRRMGSERQAGRKGTPGGRMRSAAAGEHRTGEDVAKRTLVLSLASAMRRKEAGRGADATRLGRKAKGDRGGGVFRDTSTTARSRQAPRHFAAERRTLAVRPASEALQRRRPSGRRCGRRQVMEARRHETRASEARCAAREPGPGAQRRETPKPSQDGLGSGGCANAMGKKNPRWGSHRGNTCAS